MVFIYALIDPFSCKVRYIGKTIRLKERLANQCNEKSNTYRCHWIQSILAKGKKPVQVVLQELNNNEDWKSAEQKWISIARKYGWDLVNLTDGGDGVVNLSGESKERLLKTWKGRKHKPESIEKMKIRSANQIISESHKDKVSEKMKHRDITWKDKLKEANRKFDDNTLQSIQSDLANGMKVIDAATKYNVHRTTVTKIKAGTYHTFKQKIRNHVKPRRYHNTEL